MGAAILPLNTADDWVFNGVTYRYDATEDRWYIISSDATDVIIDDIDTLNQDIIRGFDERDSLIELGTSKNNQQDAAIAELDGRVDQIASNIGVLEFKGLYTYELHRSKEACDAALAACLTNDPFNSACNREYSNCTASIGQPVAPGKMTSWGSADTLDQSLTEHLLFHNKDANGNTYDWVNTIDAGDYIEVVEKTQGDTVLYEVLQVDSSAEGPTINTEVNVKFLKETGTGDGNFNLTENYDIRIFKKDLGIDINEADARYVQKPYVVYFEDNAIDISPVHTSGNLQNGELWYDTDSLELFVWNNTAWTPVARPPSEDNAFQSLQADVDQLRQEAYTDAQNLNSVVSDALLENNIYYSDSPPVGDITGTLRNGDLWVDSDDLEIKFYSMGAWINPDRQVGGDYLEKTGGTMTGDLAIEKDPAQSTGAPRLAFTKGGDTAFSMWQYGDDEFRIEIAKDYDFKILNTHSNNTLYSHIIIRNDFTEIHSLKDPATDDQAVNLGYLNTNYLSLTGGTITGNVHINDSSNNLAIDFKPNEPLNKFDLYGDQRITGMLKVKKASNAITGSNSFEADQTSVRVFDIPLIVKKENFENLKVTTVGDILGREGVVPTQDRQLANKKYVDDQKDVFIYVAQNGLWDSDAWQNSANDGKFSASGQLANGNGFWFFSDIDQNGRLLNLREFVSSAVEKIYIQIGHYSHTYLNDPNVNRDGMKIVWAGLVDQVNRVKTGPVNAKVLTPGWELFLNSGTNANDTIPGGTITSGDTYHIKFGGLL